MHFYYIYIVYMLSVCGRFVSFFKIHMGARLSRGKWQNIFSVRVVYMNVGHKLVLGSMLNFVVSENSGWD